MSIDIMLSVWKPYTGALPLEVESPGREATGRAVFSAVYGFYVDPQGVHVGIQ